MAHFQVSSKGLAQSLSVIRGSLGIIGRLHFLLNKFGG